MLVLYRPKGYCGATVVLSATMCYLPELKLDVSHVASERARHRTWGDQDSGGAHEGRSGHLNVKII